MQLSIPDPHGKTFNQWANELYRDNLSVTPPTPPPDERAWRGWANLFIANYQNYPGASGYYSWKSWADALIAIEI